MHNRVKKIPCPGFIEQVWKKLCFKGLEEDRCRLRGNNLYINLRLWSVSSARSAAIGGAQHSSQSRLTLYNYWNSSKQMGCTRAV